MQALEGFEEIQCSAGVGEEGEWQLSTRSSRSVVSNKRCESAWRSRRLAQR